MGLFGRIFGGSKKQEDPRAAARAAGDRALDSLMGIEGKAKIVNGYATCPDCNWKFPVPLAQIQAESGGIPVMICGKCSKKLRV